MTNDAKMITRSNVEILIPGNTTDEIIKNVPASSAALTLFKQLPNMSSKQKTLPIASSLPSAYFLNGDTDMKKTTNAEWDKLTLTAEEIAVIIPIPDAVLDDASYNIWDELKPQITEAFGLAIDEAIFFGTNKPASYPNAIVPEAISKGAVVSIGTNEDIAGDIIGEGGVMEKVENSGFRVSGFYADSTLEAKFRNLRDKNNQLLYTPGLTAALPMNLVGRPLYYDQIGGVFDRSKALLIAGDFTKAIFSIRQDITYKVLDQAIIQNTDGSIAYNLAQQDMSALRCVMRLGIQIANPVSRKGGADRYPFAVLTPSANA